MKHLLRNGGSLIELIIIFALALLLLPTLLIGLTASREGRAQQMRKSLAIAQLKGVAEVVKNIKESSGWVSLPANGTYYPVISQNKWVLSPGTNTVNGLTTSVVISDVQRDAAGHIVSTGGTIDSSTRKIVSTVSWTTPTASSVSVVTYVSRFRTNATSLDTTTADFTLGSASGTTIADTLGSGIPGDGEVTLGAGGHGNWCSPSSTGTTVDLPKNGVANAVWAVEGKVSAATGDNASGVSFANVLVGNQMPPVAAIEGTFDGYKTNGVFIDTDYAYIGTDTNSKEVVIIDLNNLNGTTNKYAESGYYNAPGSTSVKSIYVSGTIGFATSTTRLYTFDLSSKTGSRPQLGSVTLAGTGTKVFVLGNYAYVSISGASTELQIIQVGNGGTSLTVVGQADVNGQAAVDVAVNSTGTRAYLATGTSSTQREMFIIDTSTKTGNRPVVGSYEGSGMNPKGIGLTPGNRAVLVGSGGEEYQVINIANESAPVRCGGMDIPSGVNGISTILETDGDAYSYIITGDATSELKIIIGGPGGQYATSGDFVSDAVQVASSAAFNSFVATANQPVQTTMQLQVAVAQAVAGSCTNATYTFVGPDSANPTTSYFTPNGTEIRGAIPFFSTGTYVNPGNCFKYKIHMTTSDVTSSPVLSDLTVNYSQ
jgi:hypothetical protein